MSVLKEEREKNPLLLMAFPPALPPFKLDFSFESLQIFS